jgi:hypothetical protein
VRDDSNHHNKRAYYVKRAGEYTGRLSVNWRAWYQPVLMDPRVYELMADTEDRHWWWS